MRRTLLGALLLALTALPLQGQEYAALQKGQVEVFLGAELHYRDIFFNKMYEVLVNLTPGVRWNMGKQWSLAAQALVPIVNDYGARYKRVRLNMAVVAKEWDWKDQLFLKVSGGLFGMERYGLDVKWMWTPKSWLALEAQAGWTGFCSMAAGWEASVMTRLTGLAGVRFYIPKAQTEFQLRGGRFIYEDYGGKLEIMRHFKHCTVGVFAQYTDVGGENGGFKVVMMIPPYKRKCQKVRVRPASNFRLTNNIEAQAYTGKMYTTDPEENEREGWFDRSRMHWGANSLAPDFVVKKQKGGEHE